MGILVPIVIFFGLCVIMAVAMTGEAIKNIEHLRRPD
jgi:hypothetical protein